MVRTAARTPASDLGSRALKATTTNAEPSRSTARSTPGPTTPGCAGCERRSASAVAALIAIIDEPRSRDSHRGADGSAQVSGVVARRDAEREHLGLCGCLPADPVAPIRELLRPPLPELFLA